MPLFLTEFMLEDCIKNTEIRKRVGWTDLRFFTYFINVVLLIENFSH